MLEILASDSGAALNKRDYAHVEFQREARD